MEIKIIERKKDFLDLLLLADEPESMIDKFFIIFLYVRQHATSNL